MLSRTGPSMLNRRLWILFVAFVLIVAFLAVRLAKLQLVDAEVWRARRQEFVHRQSPIDSYRGNILDRNGNILAQDVPSDELAIDYRAMNLDDAWLKKKAVERMRVSGEWAHLKDSQERNQRIREIKEVIARQIDAIPRAIGTVLARIDSRTPEEITDQILYRL